MVFDRKIIIKSPTAAVNASGERTITYTTLCTTFAEKVFKRSSEQTSANQLIGTTTETFRIRYRSGISQNCILVYESITWEIKGIETEGRNQFLTIECEKRDNNG